MPLTAEQAAQIAAGWSPVIPTHLWLQDAAYRIGEVVVDRGGLWLALAANQGSQPISGNVNWALVGGTSSVDVTVTPPELATAPFYEDPAANPGLAAIPAPGAGLILLLTAPIYSVVTDGDAWADPAIPIPYYGNPADGLNALGGALTALDALDADLSSVERQAASQAPGSSAALLTALAASIANKPIVLQTDTDVTNGKTTIGSRSVTYRLFYTIVPAVLVATAQGYYAITWVVITPKTFTVAGDASALLVGDGIAVDGSTGNDGDYTLVSATFYAAASDAITGVVTVTKTFTVAGNHVVEYPAASPLTITGSTGNDGTYTIVSATLNGGDTDIVVVETVPDATADGTLAHPDETLLVVSETIPDATGDGWVQV